MTNNKMVNDIAKAMAWTAIDVDLELLKDHDNFHFIPYLHRTCKFCQAKVKKVKAKNGNWEHKRIK